MFQNRITEFVTEAFFSVEPQPATQDSNKPPAKWTMPTLVRTADIYQAARSQAIQDHELDKLFNPEYYDYQI